MKGLLHPRYLKKYLFFHLIIPSEQPYDVDLFFIPTIPSLQMRKLRLG